MKLIACGPGLVSVMVSATMIAMPGSAAAAPEPCEVNLGAPSVIAAIKQLPPYPGTDWMWDADPRYIAGNYNECAPLSTALVSVERATGSSPVTALIFHNGSYVGTATAVARGYTSFNASQTTDDTVVLDYRHGQSCGACQDGVVTSVRYRWDGDHVTMLDPLPQ